MTTCMGLLCTFSLMAANNVVDTLTLAHVECTNSMPVKKANIVEFTAKADIPVTGAIVLKQNILNWFSRLVSEATDIQQIRMGQSVNVDSLLGYYSQNYLKQTKKEILMILKENKDNEKHWNYTVDISLQRVYETRTYITFCAETYTYSSGAHGLQGSSYATFRKADGKLLSWNDVLNTKNRLKFNAKVADGIQRYFGMTNFVQLKDRLQIEGNYNRTTFPLPKGNPAFVSDGLKVHYELYEIASYADGSPSFAIPYAELKDFLSPMVKQLIIK